VGYSTIASVQIFQRVEEPIGRHVMNEGTSKSLQHTVSVHPVHNCSTVCTITDSTLHQWLQSHDCSASHSEPKTDTVNKR